MDDFIYNLLLVIAICFMLFGKINDRNINMPNVFQWLIPPT